MLYIWHKLYLRVENQFKTCVILRVQERESLISLIIIPVKWKYV
jgi:hypothetical protein